MSKIRSQYPNETKVIKDSGEELGTLLRRDQLPGISPHERFHLESLPLQGEALDYPQMVTYKVEKEGETNWSQFYILQKKSEDSQWVLIQAWKQNSIGSERTELMGATK